MKSENTMKKGAIKHLLKILVQRVIGYALFVAFAGTIKDLRGNLYFLVYFLSSVASCIILFKGHQETLSAREKKQQDICNKMQIILQDIYIVKYFTNILQLVYIRMFAFHVLFIYT